MVPYVDHDHDSDFNDETEFLNVVKHNVYNDIHLYACIYITRVQDIRQDILRNIFNLNPSYILFIVSWKCKAKWKVLFNKKTAGGCFVFLFLINESFKFVLLVHQSWILELLIKIVIFYDFPRYGKVNFNQ